MVKTTLRALILCLCLSVACSSFADKVLDALIDDQFIETSDPFYRVYDYDEDFVFTVGIEDANKLPLHGFVDGVFRGKYREILDTFAHDCGITLLYKALNRHDVYDAFYTGDVDLKFPDNPVWKAADKAKFSIVYSNFIYYYIEGFFVKKSRVGMGLSDCKLIGVIDGAAIWQVAYLLMNDKIPFITGTYCAELLSDLNAGKIDALVCNYDVMKHLLENYNALETIVFDVNLPFIDDYYYLSTIKHPDIITLFNKWLSENRDYIKMVMFD